MLKPKVISPQNSPHINNFIYYLPMTLGLFMLSDMHDATTT